MKNRGWQSRGEVTWVLLEGLTEKCRQEHGLEYVTGEVFQAAM